MPARGAMVRRGCTTFARLSRVSVAGGHVFSRWDTSSYCPRRAADPCGPASVSFQTLAHRARAVYSGRAVLPAGRHQCMVLCSLLGQEQDMAGDVR